MSNIRDEIAQSRQISTTTNQKSNEKKIENTGIPEQSNDVPFKVIHLMQFDNGMFNPYPIIHERKKCSKIDNKLDRNEIEDETEEELERQEELQRDEELTRILRDVKLPGISAIATAAAAIAENLPAATTPKKPGRPRAATAVAEKPAEKTGRTRAAVIGKAGQKEDEEQEEVPATSSAPAEKKILKKVEQKDSEDPAFDAEKEEDEESEEVEVVQEKKTTLKKPKAEEKRMVLYEREPIKKIVKRKTEFSVAKKKKRRKKRMKRKLEVRQEEAMSNSCIGLRK
ncbi:titin-like [Chenopodium quinoa]|uniref:titin-like n=1 Tax=Chenopodium quinoa TaxID=63459 RepID=UPI000B76B8E3|nr:titin-like [Chenopodium quinoa]